jgi:hypothetical protein
MMAARRGALPGVVAGRVLGRGAKLTVRGAGVGMGPVGMVMGLTYTSLKRGKS